MLNCISRLAWDFCFDLYLASTINETPDCPRGEGKTAICPKCDIDSVLPDSIDSGLSLQLLELMQKEYL